MYRFGAERSAEAKPLPLGPLIHPREDGAKRLAVFVQKYSGQLCGAYDGREVAALGMLHHSLYDFHKFAHHHVGIKFSARQQH